MGQNWVVHEYMRSSAAETPKHMPNHPLPISNMASKIAILFLSTPSTAVCRL